MSDLIAKIRSAQIRAGEAAVCDHLREIKACASWSVVQRRRLLDGVQHDGYPA